MSIQLTKSFTSSLQVYSFFHQSKKQGFWTPVGCEKKNIFNFTYTTFKKIFNCLQSRLEDLPTTPLMTAKCFDLPVGVIIKKLML